MTSWCTGTSYRQSYKRKKDNFTLENDRVSVHSIWVTDDEEKALNKAKAEFEATSEKLNEAVEKLEKYESEPEKIGVFESDEWNLIKDTEEFSELCKRENYFSLSKDEIVSKLNNMVLEFAKKPENVSFSKKEDKEDVTEKVNKRPVFSMKPLMPVNGRNERKSRYGNLFAKEK